MAIPTVYRWDDGNAPVLSGTKGSVINILRKCLVDGYGEKVGAGWTLEFINATEDIAAFRNNPLTGTGFFLHVNEAAPEATLVDYQGYELMTSETDGIGLFNESGVFTVPKSTVASTAARVWVLIADEKFFYLIMWYSLAPGSDLQAGAYSSVISFGDFISIHEGGYNCMLAYHLSANYNIQSGLFRFSSVPAAANTAGSFSRPLAGTPDTPTKFWCGAVGGPGWFVTTYSSMMRSAGPAYNGQLYLSRPIIGDLSTYDFRGYVPGLYHPGHDNTSFSNMQIVEEDGRTFFNYKQHGYYSSAYHDINTFIEIGAEWV